VVRLASTEGAWSCVSSGLSEIWLFFVLVGVVLCMSLLIYDCHHLAMVDAIVIIGHGWYSSALVLWGFSITTRLSTITNCTTTSFARSNDGGARTTAHLWLALVSVIVARWSKYLFVIFCYFLGCLYCCWWLLIDLRNFWEKNQYTNWSMTCAACCYFLLTYLKRDRLLNCYYSLSQVIRRPAWETRHFTIWNGG
jgi:hypothetical protein